MNIPTTSLAEWHAAHMIDPTISLAAWNAELKEAIWHLAPQFGMTQLTRYDNEYISVRRSSAAPEIAHHPEVWDHALDEYYSTGDPEAIECLITG